MGYIYIIVRVAPTLSLRAPKGLKKKEKHPALFDNQLLDKR